MLVICVNLYRMLFSIVPVVFAVLKYECCMGLISMYSIVPVVFAVLNAVWSN